jgi:hypothetical protein
MSDVVLRKPLSHYDVAVLNIVGSQSGIRQVHILGDMIDAISSHPNREVLIKYLNSNNHVYSTVEKLMLESPPYLALEKARVTHISRRKPHPIVAITQPGRYVLGKLHKFNEHSLDVGWLISTYFAERNHSRNPKLVDSDWLDSVLIVRAQDHEHGA